jgi:hypothetical protein
MQMMIRCIAFPFALEVMIAQHLSVTGDGAD